MTNLLKIFNEINIINKPLFLAVDLDGVLCNFNRQFKKYSGEDPVGYEEKYGKDAFWSFADKAGETFWTSMEWMPDGKQLWHYIEKYDPTILSAPSRNPTSSSGKVKWLKNHVNLPNYNLQTKAKHGWDGTSKIILNSDKFRFAKNKTDLLIDDTPKKIEDWCKAGGTGILHKNTNDTIKQLKELGL